jgi:hypothetical protein
VPQGACFEISPTDNTAASPIRAAITEGELTALFTALARLPLLEKHAAWYPATIVEHYTHLPPMRDKFFIRASPAHVARLGGFISAFQLSVCEQ